MRFLFLTLAACTAQQTSSSVDLPQCADGQLLRATSDGWACGSLGEVATVNPLAVAPLDCRDGQVPAFKSGAWTCSTITAGSSGGGVQTINTPPGSGLVGGGSGSELSLAVSFTGAGSAATAARSDHTHTFTGILGVPAGFVDGVDNDTLGALFCGDGEIAAFQSATGTWVCTAIIPGVVTEQDPLVNALGKAALACANGQVPTLVAGVWTCATTVDTDTLPVVGAACADGTLLSRDFADVTGWSCVSPVAGGQGDITAVTAGPGLTGGATQGNATLSVDFGSACASGKVACDNGPAPAPSLSSVLTAGADAGARRITGLQVPVAGNDAATKAYVDAAVGPGSTESTLALCCGASCSTFFAADKGWNCDLVGVAGSTNTNNKIVTYLPDQRGIAVVPTTGTVRLNTGASGTTTTLATTCDSGSEWSVCSNRAVTEVQATCGPLRLAARETWACDISPLAYVWVPNKRGVLFTDGTSGGATNAYLTDTGSSTGVGFDCSGADEPGAGGSGLRSFLCYR